MDIDTIKNSLLDKKSAIRRKAAKEIGKNNLFDLGNELFELYKKESESLKSWEIQMEIIKSIGLIKYLGAYKVLEQICLKNVEDSIITTVAGEAYVRIKRSSIHDAKPVIEILKYGKHSLIAGAFDALGYDRMLPPDEEIVELIKLSEKPECKVAPQFDDPRYGLAAAAAGWKKELVEAFLLNCMQSNNEPLKYVASNSLKGKYVKLR